jgi:hypothetical protein
VSATTRATLHYAHPSAFEPVAVDIDVRDGRAADLPGWQGAGFDLVQHVAAVTSWDEDEVAAIHHAEVEALARTMTGCDHALVSGHILRSPEASARHADLGPITFVHSDFAVSYLDVVRRSYEGGRYDPALVRNGIDADALGDAKRIVILQTWRNIGPPRMDLPIAFCDARTVDPSEARPIPVADYAGSGIDFEALAVAAPEDPGQHGWYWFPELTADETVVFRTFDTDLARAGRTFFTPHSAFRDPTVRLGEPSRSSIELRAVCLFL